jgi:hypothetical protein
MYVFISASVNNDNLAVLLSSLGLWMLTQLSNPKYHISNRWLTARYLLLGVVLGLAALTKSQTLALAPITALVVTVRAVRRRSWREFLVGGLATALPLLLIAGWWYLRNLRLYGDLSGVDMFIQILGQRDVPADLPQLWRERFSFMAGYWGNFGGLNVPMGAWTYPVLNTIVPVAGLGLVVAITRYQISNIKRKKDKRRYLTFGICHLIFDCHLPFLICLLWALLVVIPWLLWARITWSSQGRLVFYAISVWSLLLATGLSGWLPRRWGRWIVAILAVFLLGLSVAAPFAWIAPAYAPSEPLTDAEVAAIPHALDVDFGGAMRLLGYNIETLSVEPGAEMALTLYWEAQAPTDRPYSVFVHLLGEGDLLIAQRDTYPGLGSLSTTRLEPEMRWADQYVIHVPETAYAPDTAQIVVGLYDYADWTRLPTGTGTDHARFGQVEVRPLEGGVANPIAINFGGQMALVGYDLDRRVVRPGGEIALTMYWRGLKKMDHNYSVSAQIVSDQEIKVAEDSNWPLQGDAPTMLWEPGDMLQDTKTLAVSADAPPGVYEVRITVFHKQDDAFAHLPVISARGEMLANHQVLTRVRVVP